MINHSQRSFLGVTFDLARAGNVPSVASNVLAALVLAQRGEPRWPDWGAFALCVFAGCLTYAGGATLNDVADSGFDARHKPERPIPVGMISRGSAAALGAAEMLMGLGLLVFAGAGLFWVAALAATILAYDWIHKKWIGSVVLMAGCRVLLGGALARTPGREFTPAFLGWVGALFVYIVVLSLIARWEYKVAPASSRQSGDGRQDAGATLRAAMIGRSVGRLLAFIPLIDAVALLCVGAWTPALACAVAVPLGRWAQRLAAAT
ncbi:MAG: UbiA family prenyltransferase [Verrucomicrobia bacterium]|nr:UbiA family prenyltransferase [Verrucomicrobiota bacterium]